MKKIGIEELLRWAFVQELPKAQTDRSMGLGISFGEAWSGVSQFGELLAVIDSTPPLNAFGAVVNFNAIEEPHADALAVADAVARLDGLEMTIPDDWRPLNDLGDLGALGQQCISRAISNLYAVDGKGRRRLRLSARSLVERNAKLGSRPVWQCDKPSVDLVRDNENGRPMWFVEVKQWYKTAFGEDRCDVFETPVRFEARTRRPPPGAYQKYTLDPDPTSAVSSRAEWELWRNALDILVEDLQGCLSEHEAIRSSLPSRPWEDGHLSTERKIIPDLTQAPEKKSIPVKRSRKISPILAQAS